MAVKFNITEVKGKMIGINGKEIYDKRFEKNIANKLEAIARNKRDKEDAGKEGEGKEK